MYVVEMKGIFKRFGAVVANNGVNFDLCPGEIHALLGENGAGKTTLMRILYGLYHADEGEIYVNGQLASIASPKNAITLGIGMVTQHFALVSPLSVTENIILGYTDGLVIDMETAQQKVANSADHFGIEVDPKALVRHLSVGQKQRVEILKALYRHARILILDEPTAVLVPQEVDALFETLRRLQQEGLSVIFISHKLWEVMNISDRVTVLRDGNVVGTAATADTTQAELARMMVGRETFGVAAKERGHGEDTVLSIENLCALDDRGLLAVKDVSLQVRSGEILGLAGVSGNGQTEMVQVLSGLRKATTGRFTVEGKDLTEAMPAQVAAAGVGRIPEDRHTGIVGDLTVAENLALEWLNEFTRNGMLDRRQILKHAGGLIDEFQIKARPTDNARTLSGGNIQKLILARVLSRQPKVVIAAQPTRGLDVGATEYVRSKLLEQRDRGAAILLISEDLDEILSLSDRIVVIYEGEIVGLLSAKEANAERLGLMMSGAVKENRTDVRIQD
jgi:ABC-type uncharacterized transport system ATPase subunit